MFLILRAIVAPLALLLLSALCCVLCLFRPFHQKNTAYYTHFICPIMLKILGVRYELLDTHNLPTTEPTNVPVVVMSNHQDNIDALLVSRVFHWTYTIIGKKSIKYIPFFGWLYWLSGMVLIDRKKRRSAHQTMNEVEQYLKDKQFSLYLFPEGTRSRGKGLQSFKKGGFRTAVNLQRDIVPVVLSDYANDVDLNKWVSARVKIKVLPAISSKGYTLDNIEELMAVVHKQFELALESMK